MANPVFSSNSAFNGRGTGQYAPAPSFGTDASPDALHDMYRQPAAGPLQTGRMTFDDVIVKTGICLALVVGAAAVSWFLANPLLTIVGVIGGLILGLVNSFKKEPSPVLIMAYAVLEGLFLGGVSYMIEARLAATTDSTMGVAVLQAVFATLCVAGVALFAYRSGKVRVSPKLNRFFMIAMGGYLLFSLANFALSFFIHSGPFGPLRGGMMGVALGLFAVLLATYSLIRDFDFAEQGVRQGLPRKYAWTAAFGLTVTLVWLYLEILRIIAILRGDD